MSESLTRGLVVMPDPDFQMNTLLLVVRKAVLRQCAEDSIAREVRHDEMVELMGGYSV
jgi:hypothetical protein